MTFSIQNTDAMKHLIQIVLVYFGLLTMTAFITNPNNVAYEEEIKSWHQKRIAALKADNGWLNLAGLFWLEDGDNKVGSATANDIILPKGTSEPYIGTVLLVQNKVSFVSSANAEVSFNGKKIKQLQVFPNEKPIVLEHKDLRWTIIQRGDQFGLRLRDLNHPNLKSFKGIETYPIDINWKVKAKFTPTLNKKIPITNVLGQTSDQDVLGTLQFDIKGKTFTLDALNGGDNKLFLIFSDKTNEKDTYHTGRFLTVDFPDKDGIVWVDFNKAVNPPCAFTAYATCPIPPKQNRIEAPILAGEKRFEDH